MLDEAVFENAQTTQQSMEETVHKLETTVDMLNNRLQGLLTDVGEEQAKIKQRISKIELRCVSCLQNHNLRYGQIVYGECIVREQFANTYKELFKTRTLANVFLILVYIDIVIYIIISLRMYAFYVTISRFSYRITFCRFMDTEDENTDSDDLTSLAASDLRSDVGGYSELPMISAYNTSMHLLTHPMPVRERGHSLSVERSSGLLNRAPEPRSKSLRLKRIHKDTSK